MRRLLIIAAAAAALLSPVLSAAQGRGEGHGRGRGEQDRGGDEGYGRGEGRGRYEREGRGPPGRGEPRGYGDRDEGRGREPYREPSFRERGLPQYEPRPDVRRYQDPRNAPPPLFRGGPGPRGFDRSWGRGERLPPMYRGSVLRDPGRFRLRTPPPGYDWVGVGPDIYLVQRSSGLVLDAIPGGF